MTISDEQLQRDKKYFFEFAQSDEAGLDFAQIKFCETMVAYISEVERLRAENAEMKAEVERLREEMELTDEIVFAQNRAGKALQSENERLREENAEMKAESERLRAEMVTNIVNQEARWLQDIVKLQAENAKKNQA